MTPIPFQPFIAAPTYRGADALPTRGKWTTLAALCGQAGIPLRATAPPRAYLVYTGAAQIRGPDADALGVPTVDLDSPETALRALEALAHSFHDHAARACVCGRGYFVAPTATLGCVMLGGAPTLPRTNLR
jgi:hypothetical protein